MKKRIFCGLICICLSIGFIGMGFLNQGQPSAAASWDTDQYGPDNLIRFHVIANSDSEEDQQLKYAVRDEILKEVAPDLAKSESLEESRKILREMDKEFIKISERVIGEWGKSYPVTVEYGTFSFPAKSYGNIVLPGGDYEAVRIKIGEAQGANWWCVLFPPLCFVNVQEATVVPVDGKKGVPLGSASENKLSYRGKKVGFFFEKFLH